MINWRNCGNFLNDCWSALFPGARGHSGIRLSRVPTSGEKRRKSVRSDGNLQRLAARFGGAHRRPRALDPNLPDREMRPVSGKAERLQDGFELAIADPRRRMLSSTLRQGSRRGSWNTTVSGPAGLRPIRLSRRLPKVRREGRPIALPSRRFSTPFSISAMIPTSQRRRHRHGHRQVAERDRPWTVRNGVPGA